MVHNLVSVRPKIIILGQMITHDMIFHVVVKVNQLCTVRLFLRRVKQTPCTKTLFLKRVCSPLTPALAGSADCAPCSAWVELSHLPRPNFTVFLSEVLRYSLNLGEKQNSPEH